MIKAAKVSFTKMKRDIFLFGIINFIAYVILFFAFRLFNLRDVMGIRVINYVALTVISLIQIHRLIRKNNGYIPFLEAFFITLFTGMWSFFLFGVFIFIYSWCDPYLNESYIMDLDNLNKLIPAVLVFFEGAGGSIIIALITMFYAGRFEDGEAKI